MENEIGNSMRINVSKVQTMMKNAEKTKTEITLLYQISMTNRFYRPF